MSARRSTFAVTLLCIAAALMGGAPAALGRTVLRGTEDLALTKKGVVDVDARVDFLAVKVHAELLRFDLWWSDLEPQRGVYDETYLSQMAHTFQVAASNGLKVIVTLYGTPRWASDRSLWRWAPPGETPGVYREIYPPSPGHLADLQTLASKIAGAFAGNVLGYECRNEPNLWTSLYPQRTPSDAAFAARRYVAMLKAFSSGVRVGDPAALVIAGATGPIGRNNRLQTSPQRFARLVKAMASSSVYDAYSHHPYAVGGSTDITPEGMPRNPANTVSLGNIATLLKIIPDKPFYLTEYGYYTKYSGPFGIFVDQARQAAFLRRAFRYAARFPQVKALIWYPYRDTGRNKPAADVWGVYSGLVTTTGSFKRAWFAFSGGTTITLTAPTAKPLGAGALLSGRLSSPALGGLGGKTLSVYRRVPGHGWALLQSVRSGTGGVYRATVRVTGTASYRVAWDGVASSPVVKVLLQ